jgi:hypothetical protein
MTNQDVIRALGQVPELRLRLIELTWRLTKEDGSLDHEKAAFLRQEIDQATAEARAYAHDTERAVQWLRELIRS